MTEWVRSVQSIKRSLATALGEHIGLMDDLLTTMTKIEDSSTTLMQRVDDLATKQQQYQAALTFKVEWPDMESALTLATTTEVQVDNDPFLHQVQGTVLHALATPTREQHAAHISTAPNDCNASRKRPRPTDDDGASGSCSYEGQRLPNLANAQLASEDNGECLYTRITSQCTRMPTTTTPTGMHACRTALMRPVNTIDNLIHFSSVLRLND
jgi:hypothetical protein